MNLRRRFIVYLAFMHAMLAGLAWWLLQQNILWLIVIEVAFAVSLAVGITIVSRLSRTLVTVRQSAQMLREGEFTTRFLEVGHPDVDTMIRVYNGMVDGLREERVRLQEQQYFLGQLLAASPGGVVILDHDGRVASLNPTAERLLGVTADSLASASVRSPGAPASAQRASARPGFPFLADLASPLAGPLAQLEPGDTRVVALSNGRRLHAQCATFIERGHPRRFYLVEELTEELRQTEKAAYEKLIRMMSHEVNNSVGATRSLLQSSLAFGTHLPDGPRAELEQALGIATARLERLNTFMRGFADVVRMPAPAKRPCEVDRLVEDCVRLVQAHTDPARVTWALDRQATIGRVDCDEAQVEQAIINILKNATEAVPPQGGTITVRTGRTDAGPFVEIEDSGAGISDDVREHLFTPFFTTKQNGQGLGLTVVQEILRRHGFGYTLDGPPGGPTRFRVTFPWGSDLELPVVSRICN